MTIVRYYNVSDHTMTIPGVVGGLAPQAAATVVADAWDSDPVFADTLARGENIGLFALPLDISDAGQSVPSVTYRVTGLNSAISAANASGYLYIQVGDHATWDLPPAADVAAGWQVRIFLDTELSGGTLCDITPDATEPDTINTLGDPISMTPTNNYVVFESDGISNWTTL